MNFSWLKRYMPRSLYGRAALILIVPIVTIQLVVSIVFIQRHYENVTLQMTQNMVLEINHLLGQINAAPDAIVAKQDIAPLLHGLALSVELPAAAQSGDKAARFDVSGAAIVKTLHGGIEGLHGVDLLQNEKMVYLWVTTRHGDLAMNFARYRVSATNPHQLLVLMIATGILMTLIAFLFMRNQLRPIKRLAAASEAFGRGEVMKYTPSGAFEVRAAGRSFLEMRARIDRQIEQRTLMLSGVSHDLRTPLTRLKLGLSMIDDSEDARADIRALDQDVAEMQGLIDGFLDFARGDAGDDLETCDPVNLVRQAVDNAVRAGHDVTLVESEDVGAMKLRTAAVLRALDNLIGNAVRYGNRAQVRVAKGSRSVRIYIEDDGPGIPAKDREEALKPFTRLEPARNQNKGSGVGLGLSIAIDIARAHGGTLRLEDSDRLGGLCAVLVLAR